MKLIGAVAGGFDPIHSGHIDHIIKSKSLCDYLIVLVSNDEDMVRKKGYCLLPLADRIAVLKSIKYVDEVIATIDKDGTQSKTLQMVHPHLFFKGGDRTPNNMPANEIATCKTLGIKIVYNVGDLLCSSSDCVRKAWAQINH